MQRYLSVALAFLLTVAVFVGCDSGSAPSDLGESSTVAFETTSDTAPEDTSEYAVDIVVNDAGFKELSVEVVLSEASTVDPSEVILPDETTITFPQSTTSGETRSFTFEVVDDNEFLEGDETIVLELRNASGASPAESMSTFTLTVTDDDVTLTVEEARDLPEDERAIVEGIVTRVEDDGIYVQDDTGALFIFDSSITGETVQGDEVRVDGTTAYFNGLFQLSSVGTDGLEVNSSGNDLPDAQTVTLNELSTGGEEYESELIRVLDFTIDDGGATTFAGGENYPVTDASGSLTLRIPSGSELEGETIPETANFLGVLGQFNGEGGGADEPDNGYQLLGLIEGDVQNAALVTIDEARQEALGATVLTEGVVTRKAGLNVYIQDESGADGATGINVRNSDLADAFDAGTVSPGDRIRAQGELDEFSGLLQISGTVTFSVVAEDVGLPTPVAVTIADLLDGGGEAYESELVTTSGLTIEAGGDTQFSGGTNYDVTDEQDTITLRIDDSSFYVGEPIPSGSVTFRGVLGQFNGFSGRDVNEGYQYFPLIDGDLE
jgi:uncharacterized protein YdeI (BOF family)